MILRRAPGGQDPKPQHLGYLCAICCWFIFLCISSCQFFALLRPAPGGRDRALQYCPTQATTICHAIDNRIIMSTTQDRPPNTAERVDVAWSWVAWAQLLPISRRAPGGRDRATIITIISSTMITISSTHRHIILCYGDVSCFNVI